MTFDALPPREMAEKAESVGAAKAAMGAADTFVLAVLAGAFIALGAIFATTVTAGGAAVPYGVSRLLGGLAFSLGLVLVVVAGAELFTGNVMVMVHGVWARRVSPAQLVAVWVASLAGNFAGSIGFAALVHGGGTLTGPGADLVAAVVKAKDAATGPQLFWRSVLCNMLVCLALWMAARTRSDGAKLAVLWWALLAFVASGFEHSVANMTVFGLGIFDGTATWAQLFRNLAWTVPGNVVGGGLLVGVAYAWTGTVTADASPSIVVAAPAPDPEPEPLPVPVAG